MDVSGETRRIADMKVFTITAIFSVLAYIWLLIILVAWTPDIITIAEGGLFVAFAVHAGWCTIKKVSASALCNMKLCAVFLAHDLLQNWLIDFSCS